MLFFCLAKNKNYDSRTLKQLLTYAKKRRMLIDIKAKDVLKLLQDDGWGIKKIKGSHVQLVHPIKQGKVTLPMHKGNMKAGTLNNILKQAGLK